MNYLKDKTILIVDDEPDLREMIVFEISNAGAKPLEAENGKAAFDIVQTQRVDIVISDVRMPGGNGIEFLEKTKNLFLTKPIFLFITAYSDISREELFARGAEGVYAKPFDLPQFMKILNRFCTSFTERLTSVINDPIVDEIEYTVIPDGAFKLGRCGALIPTRNKVFTVSTYIRFKIKFNENEIIAGIGDVLWCGILNTQGEYAIGIEFCFIEENSRDFTFKKLAEQTGIPYVPERTEKLD